MPTVTWDANFNASPADADEIKYGANKIRQLKIAIAERLDVEHSFSSNGLHVPGKVSCMAEGSTSQINAIANAAAGSIAWNTSLSAIQRYSGNAWVSIVGPGDANGRGTLQLANNAEAIAGTDANKAITPAAHAYAHASDAPVANKAQMEAASSNTTYVTPGMDTYHPGVAKAWAKIYSDGTILAGFGVSSVSHDATGIYTVHFTIAFASIQYVIMVDAYHGGGSARYHVITYQVTDRFIINFWDGTPTAADPEAFYVLAFGSL